MHPVIHRIPETVVVGLFLIRVEILCGVVLIAVLAIGFRFCIVVKPGGLVADRTIIFHG